LNIPRQIEWKTEAILTSLECVLLESQPSILPYAQIVEDIFCSSSSITVFVSTAV